MTDEDDAFMTQARALFAEERYDDVLHLWGAETSNSPAFKESAFAGYTPTANDVIISTYPKSGTTWSMQIAYQIGYLGAAALDHIDSVVPWPDKLIPMENPDLSDTTHLADSPTGLHVIKSHLEPEFIPINDDARYISIIRDPKDMLVSLSIFENGFNRALFGAEVPTNEWVDSFVGERFMYQNWAEFIDAWWQLCDRENVLVLLYEDMLTNSQATIRQIADFLTIDLTTEQFAVVEERSSFAWMKANDHLFAMPAWGDERVPLVREGKTGSAKQVFTDEQRARIDAHCQAELDRIGSNFPYAATYSK